MERVGDFLRKARVGKNISTKKVASETKIKESFILAIEGNDWEALPPATFVKGFIRNYAQFLGLSPETAVALFRREFNEAARSGHTRPFLTRLGPPFLRVTPARLVVGSFVLVTLFFVLYLFSQLRIFTGAPSLSVVSPANNATVSTTTITLEGKTDPNSALRVNGQPFTVDTDGRFVGPIRLSEGLNEIEIVAQNKSGKETKVKRSVIVRSTP